MSLEDRDRQLRHSMLTHARMLGNKDADRWASCSSIAIVARDHQGHGVDSEEHAARLIDELIEAGFLAEQDQQLDPRYARNLKYRRVQLTTLGFKLWGEQISAHPLVWDRRVG